MGLLKGLCVESKEGTSAVLLQSSLNERWCVLSAKRHRFIVWWEHALWKTFWATFLRTDYSIWFIGWVSPYHCERPVKNPSSWKESLTWIVPRIRIVRGVNLKGWRTGRRSCEVGNDGRIGNLLKKASIRKRWYFPKKKENLFFQSKMDESSPLEEIKTWEHPPWYGSDQCEEKVTLIFLENRVSSTTSWLVSVCQWKRFMIFGLVRKLHIPPSLWTQSHTLLAERRIILHPLEIHWRLQNYSCKLGCLPIPPPSIVCAFLLLLVVIVAR